MGAATSSSADASEQTSSRVPDRGGEVQTTLPCRSNEWAKFFLSYPLQRVRARGRSSVIANENNAGDERNLELLLHNPNVYIRSAHRTPVGTWVWKPRQIVLLRPRLDPTSLQCRCRECSAPVVLLYDYDINVPANRCLPTGAARLLYRSNSGLTVSANLVPHHPLHVELALATTITYITRSDCSDVFAGDTDLPRKKRTLVVAEEDSFEAVKYAWRLKFTFEEAAMLWRDALTEALKPSLPTETFINHDTSGNVNTSATSSTGSTSGAAVAPRVNSHVIVLTIAAAFVVSFKAVGGWWLKMLPTIAGWWLEFLPSLTARVLVPAKNAAELECEDDVNERMPLTKPKTPKSIATAGKIVKLVSNQSINKRGNISSSESFSTDDYTQTVTEDLPEPQSTPYREMLGFLSKHSGILASVELWLVALASIVLVVATSSLINQALPALFPSEMVRRFFRHVGLAIASLSFAALLCHDTYVNHLTLPLQHGLYWYGWIQCLVAFASLMLGKSAAKRALGLPIVRQLSPARSVSAGLSGCAVTFAAPLALRGIYAMDEGRMHDATLTWAGAVLVFWVGLYFLGRAVRHMTAFGGIPVGVFLHQFSLLPARLCYATLSFAGDVTHSTCIFLLQIVHPLWKVCYQIGWQILHLGAPFRRLLRILKDSVKIIVRHSLNFIESASQVISQNLVRPVFTIFARILSYLLRKCAVPILRSLHKAVEICIDGVIHLGRPIKRVLSSGCHAIVILRDILNPIFANLGGVFSYVAKLLGIVFDKLAAIIGPPIVAICSKFNRYWKLVPAGLVLNGSLTFARASVSAGTNMASSIQFMLGAWALLLIGLTIMNAVLTTVDGNLMSQRIVIADSVFFRHIDLHIGYAMSQTFVSGWHALSTALRLTIHAFDIVIRRSFGCIWEMLKYVQRNTAMRVFGGAKHIFDAIWNSPVFGLVFSFSTLCAIFLHHIGTIHFPGVSFLTKIHAMRIHGYFGVISTSFLSFLFARLELLKPPILLVVKFFGDTYGPVVSMKSTSPSSAFACWAFSCTIKWSCDRIRLKVFALPAIYFYISGMTETDIMRVFIVSFASWGALSIVVDRYETEQQNLAEQALPSFLSKRRQMPDDIVPQRIKSTYEQSNCSICLEGLDNDVGNATKVVLPCGHEFHRLCIEDWLLIQPRCPICRRATHGFDRILEVVF